MSPLDDIDDTLATIRGLHKTAGTSVESETAAVYGQMGDLLKTEPMDRGTSDEIQDLAVRLAELHKITEAEDLERAAIWAADHIDPWTEGMAA